MPKLWSQWGRSHSPHVQSVAPLGTGNSDVGEKIAQVSSSDVDEKQAEMTSCRGAPHDVGEKNTYVNSADSGNQGDELCS